MYDENLRSLYGAEVFESANSPCGGIPGGHRLPQTDRHV